TAPKTNCKKTFHKLKDLSLFLSLMGAEVAVLGASFDCWLGLSSNDGLEERLKKEDFFDFSFFGSFGCKKRSSATPSMGRLNYSWNTTTHFLSNSSIIKASLTSSN
ncbi:hypothetical protein, partial [Streptococcus anginosus]|uniref:hypothetical protein n=1 Tax=Streptococcus anginosus TaxID=1328 RepID=UPI002ED92E46